MNRSRKNAFRPRLVLAAGVLLSLGTASGATFVTTNATYGDDSLTSTLNPYPVIAVSSIQSSPPGQCAWINAGLTAFMNANPSDGSGPSRQAWYFTWAGATAEAQVEAGLSIIDYFPYVITQPPVTAANGTNYAGSPPTELGGAVMNLRYTPQAGAPTLTNLQWVQGLNGSANGMTIPTGLDNFTNYSTFTRDMSSPFYNDGGTAGQLTNGGGWFLDTPQWPEAEYETNPVISIQFQVVIANDVQTTVGGIVSNTVTLYGGDWWGFSFSAVDVPEPAACALVVLGGSGLFLMRRVTRRKRVT